MLHGKNRQSHTFKEPSGLQAGWKMELNAGRVGCSIFRRHMLASDPHLQFLLNETCV